MQNEEQIVLSPAESRRYARHLALPDIGPAGQARLGSSSVLVVGMGGLGSPAALYLAAAGVGTLGLVDFDVVDESNLQRQILHGAPDVGRAKVDSALETLATINPLIRLVAHRERLTSQNALGVLADYDVVVDGSDNFATRYLLNDACVLSGKPVVYGAVYRFEGQVSVFDTTKPDAPCYRCLFPTLPAPGESPDCATGGVLGVLPGVVGSLQASEAIKLLLGIGEPLIGRLLLFDALRADFRELRLPKNPNCPVCGTNPTVRELMDYDVWCATTNHNRSTIPTKEETQILPTEITAPQLKARIDAAASHSENVDFTLIDVREPYELAITGVLPDAVAIPMNDIPRRQTELDPDAEIIVMCRSGARSGQVQAFLKQQGFANVVNLRGGILAWSDEVDASVPKY